MDSIKHINFNDRLSCVVFISICLLLMAYSLPSIAQVVTIPNQKLLAINEPALNNLGEPISVAKSGQIRTSDGKYPVGKADLLFTLNADSAMSVVVEGQTVNPGETITIPKWDFSAHNNGYELAIYAAQTGLQESVSYQISAPNAYVSPDPKAKPLIELFRITFDADWRRDDGFHYDCSDPTRDTYAVNVVTELSDDFCSIDGFIVIKPTLFQANPALIRQVALVSFDNPRRNQKYTSKFNVSVENYTQHSVDMTPSRKYYSDFEINNTIIGYGESDLVGKYDLPPISYTAVAPIKHANGALPNQLFDVNDFQTLNLDSTIFYTPSQWIDYLSSNVITNSYNHVFYVSTSPDEMSSASCTVPFQKYVKGNKYGSEEDYPGVYQYSKGYVNNPEHISKDGYVLSYYTYEITLPDRSTHKMIVPQMFEEPTNEMDKYGMPIKKVTILATGFDYGLGYNGYCSEQDAFVTVGAVWDQDGEILKIRIRNATKPSLYSNTSLSDYIDWNKTYYICPYNESTRWGDTECATSDRITQTPSELVNKLTNKDIAYIATLEEADRGGSVSVSLLPDRLGNFDNNSWVNSYVTRHSWCSVGSPDIYSDSNKVVRMTHNAYDSSYNCSNVFSHSDHIEDLTP